MKTNITQEEQEGASTLSRRSFIGLGALGALSLGAAGLAGCAPQGGESSGDAQGSDSAAPSAEELPAADRTEECDVAVVGMGVTGVIASSAAAQAGAKVVGLDCVNSIDATNAVNTAGIWAIESAEELKYDNHLTVEDMFDFIWSGTHYQSNARALRNLLPASGKAIDLAMEAGAQFMFPFAEADESMGLLNRGGHIWATGGTERGKQLQGCMDHYGVDSRWESEVASLLLENGAVTGVRYVDADGQLVDLKAKNVIVCTGGFIQNLEMVEKYYAGARMYGPGNRRNDGAGITMAMQAGAQMGKNFSTSINESGACNVNASTCFVGQDYNTTPLHCLPLLGGLFVNKDGVRFMDEGKMATETMYCAEPMLRESTYYVILDQVEVDELMSTPLVDFVAPSAYANMAPVVQMSFEGVTLTSTADTLASAEEEGWVWKADDIATLAEKAQLPALAETVDAYNAFCDSGKDELMYKSSDFMKPVKTGPFYAVELNVAAWLTLGGIKTDECCRALDAENNVIDGLFVAGADGDFWAVPYHEGGSAQGFCFASGYLSGTTAAETAK
ncbi:FAD-binding protein [Eggerthella sp. YY7918]|uniref:FAD-dependent oxidoreductase n=1 Tax=Eggerthella sp. (strain YY7918) TaxID=502558 RepID=UPI0002171397|nr:FAD-binding protein [Eggerthella sp. YY7918]BAK45356.1 hypothetical protein EGYY_22830 [Eggerthella sp. YY7918]